MLDWIGKFFGSESFTIFVSHSFKDTPWLDDYLTGIVINLGAKCIMAEHNFGLSSEGSVSHKVAEMIDQSDALLAILSSHGQASGFVQQEIGYAYKAGKPVIALIESAGGEVKVPGFLYDKDVLVYEDVAALDGLKAKLQKIIKYAWGQKKDKIKSGIVAGGIVIGALMLGSRLPEDDEDQQ
jgi:hypothetical protein